jgi:predicted dehydrogenase
MKLHLLLSTMAISTMAALGAEIRVGIIGCDTSHCTAFTELMNNPNAKGHVPGTKVVAAFAGGSPDLPGNDKLVADYSKTLKEKYNVKFYDTIEELCKNVDAVLLESVDGRPHLAQVTPVIKAGKPVFVDKPMAGSLRDVLKMFELAKAAKVPLFSASSLRFDNDTQAVRNGSIGTVQSAETYGPCKITPHQPDLYNYGIHGTEALFTVMGTGCETVERGKTDDGKIQVTGTWKGGRKGVFREDGKFRGSAQGDKGEAQVGGHDGYAALVAEIVKFFQSGVSPVKPEETIEIFAFMEAADESKKLEGKPVKIADMIKQAKAAE